MAFQEFCHFESALILIFHPYRQRFHTSMEQKTGVRIEGTTEVVERMPNVLD